MWKWLDKVGEFALTNVRVIRDAWGAFTIWCAIALVACWYVADRVYDVRLSNARSSVNNLASRLTSVEGNLRDAQRTIAGQVALPAQRVEQDPDSLYQLGMMTARAPGGLVDRSTGTVQLPKIVGYPDLNMNADMYYRQFILTACTYGKYGIRRTDSVVTSQLYFDVTCQISGLHP